MALFCRAELPLRLQLGRAIGPEYEVARDCSGLTSETIWAMELMDEPFRLKRWRIEGRGSSGQLSTCARPGRSKGTKQNSILDMVVSEWVRGLPGPETKIVSLLGRKPSGKSEFAFYSFFGVADTVEERSGRMSFQQWLDRWHHERAIHVIEHPTDDMTSIPTRILEAVSIDVLRLLREGNTVVIAAVCRFLNCKGSLSSHS
jgi:hypothetical protein